MLIGTLPHKAFILFKDILADKDYSLDIIVAMVMVL